VQAGEESSALPHMLSQLANYYEREVEHRIHQLTTLLEPLLILIIGGLIGILAVALYQPIFQIGHQL
ncbi:MAG TPA: type II secretion system F family protein, partial [Gammaproteobacteria bacterium]|nr:type II secretion system F family protein [Gammaproteobacteria bacterium]